MNNYKSNGYILTSYDNSVKIDLKTKNVFMNNERVNIPAENWDKPLSEFLEYLETLKM